MDKLLEQLSGILSKESEIHQDLLKTAKTFNEAIKAEDLDSIQNCTSIHDEQVYQIAKLEEKRIECTSEIAGLLGIEDEIPKISSILLRVPQQWQKLLSALQIKLKEQIMEITKINTSNRILLQDGLSFISNNVKIFQQSTTRNFRYGGKGKSAGIPVSRNLINKVV